MRRKVIVIYLPVLQDGYRQFLAKHSGAEAIYLFGPMVIAEFDHLTRKDIRAVPPEIMQVAVQSIMPGMSIRLLTPDDYAQLRSRDCVIIMPDEDECRLLEREHLSGCDIVYESHESLGNTERWSNRRLGSRR